MTETKTAMPPFGPYDQDTDTGGRKRPASLAPVDESLLRRLEVRRVLEDREDGAAAYEDFAHLEAKSAETLEVRQPVSGKRVAAVVAGISVAAIIMTGAIPTFLENIGVRPLTTSTSTYTPPAQGDEHP